jgi:PIN domain nuclease of toxin-antitoxin system
MAAEPVKLSARITGIAISAATLPHVHCDPFDRIIIAEALKENVSVLTKDRTFAEYGACTLG